MTRKERKGKENFFLLVEKYLHIYIYIHIRGSLLFSPRERMPIKSRGGGGGGGRKERPIDRRRLSSSSLRLPSRAFLLLFPLLIPIPFRSLDEEEMVVVG